MRILLTNDDGIVSEGLRALYAALTEAGHQVAVVAPASEQSGVSSTLTLSTPLRVTDVLDEDFHGQAVHGTPVDCVKLAVTTLLPQRPDLVISGMNAGNNIGTDVFYSGTVGAAMEAALLGLPALAVSRGLHERDDPYGYARHTASLLTQIPWAFLPHGRVLNLNYPRLAPAKTKGLRVCPISMMPWTDVYQQREDPRGRPYWWLSGFSPKRGDRDDCDATLLNEGWMTLTPLMVDMSDEVLSQSLSLVLHRNED